MSLSRTRGSSKIRFVFYSLYWYTAKLSSKIHTQHVRTTSAGFFFFVFLMASLFFFLFLVILHVRRCGVELEIALDDLVDCAQKVLLCGYLSSCSDGKHACLCTDTS